MKKISIISYFFYPELTPRAFRTYELTKELSKRGYEVDVYLPNKRIFNKIEHNGLNTNVKLNFIPLNPFLNFFENNKTKNIASKGVMIFLKVISKLLARKNKEGLIATYANDMKRYFQRNPIETDLLIDISAPFVIHYGRYISRGSIKAKKIFSEYSDPFTTSKDKVRLISKEKSTLSNVDYIIVPTEIAIPNYKLKNSDIPIAVIPQGFDFSNIKLFPYIVNKKPTFAFAGNFLKKMREPHEFFKELCLLKEDFDFIVYCKTSSPTNINFLKQYKEKLGDKLKILPFIEREKLIPELGLCDFLINFDNDSKYQTPSKLIDYAITSRPILNVTNDFTEKTVFYEFLKGNFENKVLVDLRKFDIKTVVNQFEELFN